MEDLALIEHQAVMASFLRGGMQPPDVPSATWATMSQEEREATRIATWRHLSNSSSEKDRTTVLQILAFPNMLETLAGMYHHGLLDYGIAKTSIEFHATGFWRRAESWVLDVRKEYNDEKIYKDLEAMIDDLAKRKRPIPGGS